MTDAFDEIQDDLRQQKLNQFWKENGAWIIGGALGAVILTAALTTYRHWEEHRNTVATTELTNVISAGDVAKLEDFAGKGDKKHAMMARFLAADTYLARKENDKALALYNDIAKTSGIGRTWSDLARLHSISLRLDKDDAAALGKELAPLTAEKNPWRHSARELQGLLAARQGHMQEAADIMGRLAADPLAPDDLRQRAMSLRAVYAADAKNNQKS